MDEAEATHILHFYYREPRPDRVVALVQFLVESGAMKGLPVEGAVSRFFGKVSGLSVDAFAPGDAKLVAFFSEVMRRDPELVDALCALGFREGVKRTLLAAAWRAGAPRELLGRHAPATSLRFVDGLFALEAGPAHLMDLAGPVVLDILWGTFFASGDTRSVERIVQALALLAQPERSRPWATGMAALWSLKSNAKQHEAVAEVVASILPQAKDEGFRILLEGILEGRA